MNSPEIRYALCILVGIALGAESPAQAERRLAIEIDAKWRPLCEELGYAGYTVILDPARSEYKAHVGRCVGEKRGGHAPLPRAEVLNRLPDVEPGSKPQR